MAKKRKYTLQDADALMIELYGPEYGQGAK
jgi:hypothetical protein